VSSDPRPMPPLNADERVTLEGWLDFHRATLRQKCEGLDDEQAAAAAVPPSAFTLTGLVQHLAEVERNWFGTTATPTCCGSGSTASQASSAEPGRSAHPLRQRR
jgi:hypothetical protein